PPEPSPLSATMLGEICREVLPAGVVNIVTGTGMPAGDAIARHPNVKRIAFTGSVPTGRAIQRAAAEGGIKHVTLELGGKNPLIAFPDMDPDIVAKIAVAGMNFAWQGQSCGSTHRLLLHEDLYKPVLERVVERVKSLRLADPLDDNAQMGPINSKRHYERVVSMVQSGVSDGAKLMAGGKRPGGSDFARGYWLEPTVFADVNPAMRIAKEEIFGPVLSVFRWKDEKEALALANSTEYGLTASIFTNDIKTAFRTARAVKSGYIWINGASGHFYGTPFGGFKNSGLGREEGIDELLSYTEVKTIHVMLGEIQARDCAILRDDVVFPRRCLQPLACRPRESGDPYSRAAVMGPRLRGDDNREAWASSFFRFRSMAANSRFDLTNRTVIVTGGGKG